MQPVSIVLRLDATNAYEPNSLERAWDIVNENTLGDAEDPRIACVVLNLLNIDGDSSLQEQCIANIQLIGALCRQREILLMVEPLVMTAMSGGNPTSIYDIDKIATLVRQAVELGADFIKVDPTDPLERFNEIVEIASGIPVFVRGGGKVTPRELLERTKIVIESGAQGVVYGRNIVQHPTPAKYVQAIAAVVHENASVDDALLRLAK